MIKMLNKLMLIIAGLSFFNCMSFAQIKKKYIGLKFELYCNQKDKLTNINGARLKQAALKDIKYKFIIADSADNEIEIDSFPRVLNEFEGSVFFFRVNKTTRISSKDHFNNMLVDSITQCDFERPLRKVAPVTKPGTVTLMPKQTYKMRDAISTLYFKNLPPGEYWVEARYKKPLPDSRGYYLQVSQNQVHFFVK